MRSKVFALALLTSPSRSLRVYGQPFAAVTPSTSSKLTMSNSTCEDRSGQTCKIWDGFAEKYSKMPIADEDAYSKKLQITQQYLRKDMEVLEYGCGTGGTSLLHAPFVKHILATDISAKMLEIANKKKEESNVSNVDFQQVSIDQLQLPDASKDVVLGLSILHLLKNRDEVIAKTHRWLKPGGLFITSTTCIGDMGTLTRFVVNTGMPILNLFGLMPYVNTITKSELKERLVTNGFSIEYEWQPKPNSAVFIIGRKGA